MRKHGQLSMFPIAFNTSEAIRKPVWQSKVDRLIEVQLEGRRCERTGLDMSTKNEHHD